MEHLYVAADTLYWGCLMILELLLSKNDYEAAYYSIHCFVESMPFNFNVRISSFKRPCMLHAPLDFHTFTGPDHNW